MVSGVVFAGDAVEVHALREMRGNRQGSHPTRERNTRRKIR
jgi:hypothetical protein